MEARKKGLMAAAGLAMLITVAGSAVAPTTASCWLPTHLVKIGSDGEWLGYVYLVGDFGFEIFDLSIYLETNGEPDLQLGGKALLPIDGDAVCFTSPAPDQLVTRLGSD